MSQLQQKTTQKGSMEWSCRFKHEDIDIFGKKITRREMSNGGYSVCIIGNCKLDNTSPEYRWTVKVHNREGALFIGACLKSYVVNDKFSYEGLGTRDHGHYVLESDGNVFLHSGQRVHKGDNYTINTNDTVQMKYISAECKLYFSKNGDSLFSAYVPATEGDSLHPLIYLGRTEDSVELIDC